jgi:mannose-6-phosphate isomerase-like protein (cupin superfamily)
VERRTYSPGDDVRIVPGCGGEIFNIFNPNNSRLGKMELAFCVFPPGEVAKLHRHSAIEEVYIVIKGEGVMSLDGNETPVSPGTAIAVEPGAWHQMRNESEDALWFYAANSTPWDPADFEEAE